MPCVLYTGTVRRRVRYLRVRWDVVRWGLDEDKGADDVHPLLKNGSSDFLAPVVGREIQKHTLTFTERLMEPSLDLGGIDVQLLGPIVTLVLRSLCTLQSARYALRSLGELVATFG